VTLLDEARAATPRKGPSCGVGLFLSTLSVEFYDEVIECVDDPLCSMSGLVFSLKERGFAPPQVQSWQRHFRKECRCD
jgi:hypothetical protein